MPKFPLKVDLALLAPRPQTAAPTPPLSLFSSRQEGISFIVAARNRQQLIQYFLLHLDEEEEEL